MSDTPSGCSAQTILVVDDAPVNLKLMRLLLTHEGYQVRATERAEDALRMLSEFRPELVLTDIRMPGMDGVELTRRIKADPRTRDVRVVALTACSMDEDRARALEAGCEDYIAKPVDSATLAARVRELLARRPAEEDAGEPDGGSGFSESEMDVLRRRFARSGAEASRRMFESLGPAFDPVQAGLHLHQWAGSAALLGYPEISRLAASADQTLRESRQESTRFYELIEGLHEAFAKAESGDAPPLPSHLVEALEGKRVALAGLDAGQAERLGALLARVNAEGVPAGASVPVETADFALVVLQVVGEWPDERWEAWENAPARKLVLMGSRRDLLALPPRARLLASEFLVDDWDAEEALLRLASVCQRPKTAARTMQPKAAVARPNVLIADDDSFILALIGSTLENYGMSCRAVANGAEALRAIREEQPHIAVLDVNMPGLDGYEVLAAVRAEELPTRVVMLTARQQEKEIVRGFELGADDYLTKPFNPFELAARLKRLLRR
jgi:two-component system, cell cycle response regulator DivK